MLRTVTNLIICQILFKKAITSKPISFYRISNIAGCHQEPLLFKLDFVRCIYTSIRIVPFYWGVLENKLFHWATILFYD